MAGEVFVGGGECAGEVSPGEENGAEFAAAQFEDGQIGSVGLGEFAGCDARAGGEDGDGALFGEFYEFGAAEVAHGGNNVVGWEFVGRVCGEAPEVAEGGGGEGVGAACQFSVVVGEVQCAEGIEGDVEAIFAGHAVHFSDFAGAIGWVERGCDVFQDSARGGERIGEEVGWGGADGEVCGGGADGEVGLARRRRVAADEWGCEEQDREDCACVTRPHACSSRLR